MTPMEFENYVCRYFEKQGYSAKTTSFIGDYGVDVFAEKDNERLAIQVKMYGNSTRKVNRQMIMELYGAKDYFDCTKAVLVTDGNVLPDAEEVASKLNVLILYLSWNKNEMATGNLYDTSVPSDSKAEYSFDSIWEKYILPLKGKIIQRSDGKYNQILDVDWAKVTRITSTGNKGTIDIEPFRRTVNVLLEKGMITRNEINQNYAKRASSGIVLILSQVPFFHVESRPNMRLVFRKE